MRRFNSKKLAGAGAHHPDDIHTQVATIFCYTGFSSLFVRPGSLPATLDKQALCYLQLIAFEWPYIVLLFQ